MGSASAQISITYR